MGIYNTNKNDYRSCDGTETVTLRNMETSTDTTCTNAFREAISVNEAVSLGIFRSEGTAWFLADVLISSANRPKPGDKITDASSVAWYILDSSRDEVGDEWRCVCKKGR